MSAEVLTIREVRALRGLRMHSERRAIVASLEALGTYLERWKYLLIVIPTLVPSQASAFLQWCGYADVGMRRRRETRELNINGPDAQVMRFAR
jgi:hypothetical protein